MPVFQDFLSTAKPVNLQGPTLDTKTITAAPGKESRSGSSLPCILSSHTSSAALGNIPIWTRFYATDNSRLRTEPLIEVLRISGAES